MKIGNAWLFNIIIKTTEYNYSSTSKLQAVSQALFLQCCEKSLLIIWYKQYIAYSNKIKINVTDKTMHFILNDIQYDLHFTYILMYDSWGFKKLHMDSQIGLWNSYEIAQRQLLIAWCVQTWNYI